MIGQEYERLLVTFGIDYDQVRKRGKTAVAGMERFFGHSQFKKATFYNEQYLDRDSFVERVISASYMPDRRHPRYHEMIEAVKEVFFENYQGGNVVLEYDTNVYYGQMS